MLLYLSKLAKIGQKVSQYHHSDPHSNLKVLQTGKDSE